MRLPRAILADDHSLITAALCQLIAPHLHIIGTVTDGFALVAETVSLKPDLALVDVGMPLLNGLEAARQMKEKVPGVKLVFLTMNEDPEIAIEAMKIGASGYVSKKSAASELLGAIQAALRGKTYVTPQIARGMQESFVRNPNGGNGSRKPTTRQREVVQLLVEGKTMKEVAEILNITPRTVAFHKYSLMEELGLKSNADLIEFAIRNHIVTETGQLSFAKTLPGGC